MQTQLNQLSGPDSDKIIAKMRSLFYSIPYHYHYIFKMELIAAILASIQSLIKSIDLTLPNVTRRFLVSKRSVLIKVS